jgi:hypothetical protein
MGGYVAPAPIAAAIQTPKVTQTAMPVPTGTQATQQPIIRKSPTVATTANPVISKTIGSGTTVDYNDRNSLQDFIDTYNVKSKFGTVKEADALEAVKAQRKLNELIAAEQRSKAETNPYESNIASAQAERDAFQAQQRSTFDAGKLAKQQELDNKYSMLKAQQEEAGRRQSEAAQRSTSTSGFGRSTFNADQQVGIAKETNSALAQLEGAKQAELARWEAEQA